MLLGYFGQESIFGKLGPNTPNHGCTYRKSIRESSAPHFASSEISLMTSKAHRYRSKEILVSAVKHANFQLYKTSWLSYLDKLTIYDNYKRTSPTFYSSNNACNYREQLSLVAFCLVYSNSKVVSWLHGQNEFSNLKATCHIKWSFVVRQKLP